MSSILGSCWHAFIHGSSRRERRLARRHRGLDLRPSQYEEKGSSSCKLRACALLSQSGRSFALDYKVTGQSIGAGMNGDVFLAQPVRDESSGDVGRYVAVKILKKAGLSKRDLVKLMHEVDIYLQMDHSNIARLLQVYEEPDDVYLIMEYCEGGSLYETLADSGPFSEHSACAAMRQVFSAVNYCHCHPGGKVCHHDLKPENFVYKTASDGSDLKMVDFGLSQLLSSRKPQTQSKGGTEGFRAPEVTNGSRHDEMCDMWSLGVIMYLLLTGEFPFDEKFNENGQESSFLQIDTSLLSGVSSAAKDLMQTLLSVNPSDRPTAYDALRHPWVTKIAQPCPAIQLSVTSQQRDMFHRMCSFARGSPIYRAAAVVACYLHGDEIAVAADEHFRAMDTDFSGTISPMELVKPLQHAVGLSVAEAREIFFQLDVDGDMIIHRSEFLAAIAGPLLLQNEHIVHEIFCRFDINHDGQISFRELLVVLGQDFCGKSTRQLFQELDANGDLSVDFKEFSLMVSHGLPVHDARVGSNHEDATLVEYMSKPCLKDSASNVTVRLTETPHHVSVAELPAISNDVASSQFQDVNVHSQSSSETYKADDTRSAETQGLNVGSTLPGISQCLNVDTAVPGVSSELNRMTVLQRTSVPRSQSCQKQSCSRRHARQSGCPLRSIRSVCNVHKHVKQISRSRSFNFASACV